MSEWVKEGMLKVEVKENGASFKELKKLLPEDQVGLIYDSIEEKFKTILPFLQMGISCGEKCFYCGDGEDLQSTIAQFRQFGFDPQPAINKKSLVIFPSKKLFDNGVTEKSDGVLLFWETESRKASEEGFTGLRITVEMSALFHADSTLEKFMEMEARFQKLFAAQKILSVKQYDRKKLPPEFIKGAIQTNPKVIFRDRVFGNPFFQKPEIIPHSERQRLEVDLLLEGIFLYEPKDKIVFFDEDHFEMLFPSSIYGFFQADREGRILEASVRFCEILGYSHREIMTKRVSELDINLTPEEISSLQRNLVTKISDRFETRFRRKDGSIVDLEMTAHFIPSFGGRCNLIVRDISMEKRMADERHLDHLRQAALLNLHGKSGGSIQELIECALEEALKLSSSRLGYIYFYNEERREFTFFAWSKSVMPECALGGKKLVFSIDRVGLGGEAVRQRKPVIFNDYMAPNPLKKGIPQGHVALERYAAVPIFRNQRIVAVLGVANKKSDYTDQDIRQIRLFMDGVWDVCEKKRAADELRRSEELFLTLTTLVPVGIFLTDSTGNCRYVNQLWCQNTGLTLEDASGPGWKKALHPEDRDKLEKLLKEGQAELVQPMEFRFLVPGKTDSWIFGISAPMRDELGNLVGFLGVNSDVTPTRRTEEEIRKARKKAEAALRQRDAFMAQMSHELRTPMHGILGFVDLLLESPLNPDQREGLETIKFAAGHLMVLINDILDLSKIESGKIEIESEEFNLAQTINESVKILFGRAREKNLQLQIEYESGLPEVVRGDPGKLMQILVNLTGNAIKFTKEGGVTIRVGKGPETSGLPCLEFCVKDTGIGISPELQNNLFIPFSQASAAIARQFGGSGLGLAISNRLVELLGGTIHLESEAGKGSSFSFTLCFERPVSQEKSAIQEGRAKGRTMESKEIPIFQPRILMENLDSGKEVFQLEALGAYRRDLLNLMESIRSSLKKNERKSLFDGLVALREASQTVGAVGVSEGCLGLLEAGSEAPQAVLEKSVSRLEAEARRLLEFLDEKIGIKA